MLVLRLPIIRRREHCEILRADILTSVFMKMIGFPKYTYAPRPQQDDACLSCRHDMQRCAWKIVPQRCYFKSLHVPLYHVHSQFTPLGIQTIQSCLESTGFKHPLLGIHLAQGSNTCVGLPATCARHPASCQGTCFARLGGQGQSLERCVVDAMMADE